MQTLISNGTSSVSFIAVDCFTLTCPLSCLSPSQHVRRAAVLALSTAAHNKPSLVGDLLPELLPLLYDQMLVKVGQTRAGQGGSKAQQVPA